jgi:hypothetical protein
MPLGLGALRGAIGGAGKAVSGALAKPKPSNAPAGRGGFGGVMRQAAGLGPTPQMLQQSQVPPMSPALPPSDSMPMDQPMQPNPFQANPFSASGIVPPQRNDNIETQTLPPGPSPMPPSGMMGAGQARPRPMMRPNLPPMNPGIGPSMQPAQPSMMGPQQRRLMRQ